MTSPLGTQHHHEPKPAGLQFGTKHAELADADWAKGGEPMLLGLYTWLVARNDERGATAVEYGLMVALIAAVIVLVVTALGQEVTAAFQKIVDAIP